MNRQELIAKANELGLTFEKPVNQTKSEVIEAAITAALEPKNDMTENVLEEMPDEVFVQVGNTNPEKGQRGRKVSTSGTTLRERIIELGKAGLTKTQIFNKLAAEHATLNYRYVVQTLIKAKISVPRQARVFPPKEVVTESAPVEAVVTTA